MKTNIDAAAARELTLFANNDASTYTRAIMPAWRNLDKKRARRVFDAARAVKLFEYVAEYAARRYAAEFARPSEWFQLFNAATRRAAAAELLADYLAEVMPAPAADPAPEAVADPAAVA